MTAPGESSSPRSETFLEAAAKAIKEREALYLRELDEPGAFDAYDSAARAALAVIGAGLRDHIETRAERWRKEAQTATDGGVVRDYAVEAGLIAAEIARLCGIEDRGPQGGPDSGGGA